MADYENDAEEVKSLSARIARMDEDYQKHRPRIEDCNKFCLPWRHKQGADARSGETLDEIFDETGMTTLEDFAADMLSTFTPNKSEWVKTVPSQKLDAGEMKMIEEALTEYKRVLWGEIQRSNLYQAAQEAYLDLGPGTMAMWIQDRDKSQPIWCQATPTSDLLIDRGPYGEVDGRFRRRKLRAEDIKVLWPKITEEKLRDAGLWFEKGTTGASKEADITDGMYLDRDYKRGERWCYRVMSGGSNGSAGKILYREEWTGQGSCPLVVARWSKDSTTAWGIGPTYRSLAAIKTLNKVRELGLKGLDLEVDPVVSYEDDGIMNLEQGLNPGDWVARALGSEPPQPIESKRNVQSEWLNVDDLRSVIRAAHYQDMPLQKGKTPPTAFQHDYEQLQKQRRMGTPASNLVVEWQYPIIYRFAYLLAKRGVLPKVQLNGKDVSLVPVAPLLLAQDQEEAVRLQQFFGAVVATFGPEALKVFVNMKDSIRKLADRWGVDIDLLNTEAEIKEAIQQIAQIAAAAQQQAEQAPS